jgi:general secretion pathway protein C
MWARIAAFVIWAAVAAGAAFWGMKLFARPTPVPAHAAIVDPSVAVAGDLGRLFGADPAPAAEAAVAAPAADARFRLIGVVAPRGSGPRDGGVALIALDGKPPKAYRVGAAVDGELVLLGVHARGAALGPRGQPAQVALELPALPPPSTGVPLGAAARPVTAPMTRPVPRAPVPVEAPPPAAAPPAEQDGADEADAEPDPGIRPGNPPPGRAGRAPA